MSVVMRRADVIQTAGSVRTAAVVAPMLAEKLGEVGSAIEVGSSVGVWSSLMARVGVRQVELVAHRKEAGGPIDALVETVHRKEFHRPFGIAQRYDLCIAVHAVAEVEQLGQDMLVRNLCSLSDCILFSCAPEWEAPNLERKTWLSSWVQKFEALGYVVSDWLRPAVWLHPKIDWRIIESLVMFVKPGSRYAAVLPDTRGTMLDIVHPWAVTSSISQGTSDAAARKGLEKETALLKQQIRTLEQEIEQQRDATEKERRNTETAWTAHNKIWAAFQAFKDEAAIEKLRIPELEQAMADQRQVQADLEGVLMAEREQISRLQVQLSESMARALDHRTETARLNLRVAELQGELASVRASEARIQAECDRLADEVAIANSREATVADRLREAQRRMQEARADAEAQKALVQALQADLDTLKSSTSWRVTEPMRKVSTALSTVRGPR